MSPKKLGVANMCTQNTSAFRFKHSMNKNFIGINAY